MGYRDDLIQRLKDEGLWEHFAIEQRRVFEQASDKFAGQFMATVDWLAIRDSETTKQVGTWILLDAFKAFLDIFGGRLLVRHGEGVGGLSKAGLLLAEFIDELEEDGIDWAAIAADLPKLNNTGLILCLRELYSRRNDEK